MASRSPTVTDDNGRPVRPITGRHVLFAMLAFFGAVMVMNVIMMHLALSTHPGTEVASSYRAGQMFNREIAAAAEQAKRAWAVEALVTRQGESGARIRVTLAAPDGSPITDVAVVAKLERPAEQRLDREVTLAAAGSGRHEGVLADVPHGRWDLILTASRGDTVMFRSRNRINLD